MKVEPVFPKYTREFLHWNAIAVTFLHIQYLTQLRNVYSIVESGNLTSLTVSIDPR